EGGAEHQQRCRDEDQNLVLEHVRGEEHASHRVKRRGEGDERSDDPRAEGTELPGTDPAPGPGAPPHASDTARVEPGRDTERQERPWFRSPRGPDLLRSKRSERVRAK